ncbi:MAG TPA: hypothetical protein VMR19_04605 [Candidatus Saccharimonadales bacterium]|jgi:hypothetical protein|nr:hypothetical protein [Candidatus Saccharimonadales bacterium]
MALFPKLRFVWISQKGIWRSTSEDRRFALKVTPTSLRTGGTSNGIKNFYKKYTKHCPVSSIFINYINEEHLFALSAGKTL